MDKDTQATRAAPDATTLRIVTGPTLQAPELEMIGAIEPALEQPPAQEGAPAIDGRPAPDIADLAARLERLGYRHDLLENGFLQQPRQPQQEAQQAKEQELPTPAAFLFATSTATLSLSKEAWIWLVVLIIALAVIGGGLYIYCRSGGFKGSAPASA
ncbi:MAG TPA: hypothetical protein VKT82_24660 [Ktedonobacterales bacterium]|nr:hypothetical protein [Ktedonobacterales bacterium]